MFIPICENVTKKISITFLGVMQILITICTAVLTLVIIPMLVFKIIHPKQPDLVRSGKIKLNLKDAQ